MYAMAEKCVTDTLPHKVEYVGKLIRGRMQGRPVEITSTQMYQVYAEECIPVGCPCHVAEILRRQIEVRVADDLRFFDGASARSSRASPLEEKPPTAASRAHAGPSASSNQASGRLTRTPGFGSGPRRTKRR